MFDGHGPFGHKVARQVRDMLPSRLCSSFKQLKINRSNCNNETDEKDKGNDENTDSEDVSKNPLFSSVKDRIIKSFEEVDEDLCVDATLDTYCSGTTAVAVLKQV